MKAIIIKDDRDIKFWDVREIRPEFYYAKIGPIIPWWRLDINSVIYPIPIYKEVYELICIRRNGDLVYRLQR